MGEEVFFPCPHGPGFPSPVIPPNSLIQHPYLGQVRESPMVPGSEIQQPSFDPDGRIRVERHRFAPDHA